MYHKSHPEADKQSEEDQKQSQQQTDTRGAGGRGEALRFAAPACGEQGVLEFIPLSHFRKPLKGPQTGTTPAADPLQK